MIQGWLRLHHAVDSADGYDRRNTVPTNGCKNIFVVPRYRREALVVKNIARYCFHPPRERDVRLGKYHLDSAKILITGMGIGEGVESRIVDGVTT